MPSERTHRLFIEVKLSEDSFSMCSAHEWRNPRKHICAEPLPFGGDVRGCFHSSTSGSLKVYYSPG